MSKSLKPPTTFAQQLNILKSRNVTVSSVRKCCSFLSRVNYYRFSGYLYPFIDKATGKCTEPVSFERIVQIYEFDTEIRNLIALAVEKVEIFLRTQLAYRTAHLYGADGYMYAKNYNAAHDHQNFLKHIKECISHNRNSPVVRHHMAVYGGSFPIWVIVDYFSLGMLSHYYTDLKNSVKKAIARDLYGVNYQTLSSWMKCLTDLRNRCAHYSRLYYWKFPSIPKGIGFTADRSLFSQICMLKALYPEPEKWKNDFVKPLKKIMSKYKGSVDKEHIGFPYRWKSILLK